MAISSPYITDAEFQGIISVMQLDTMAAPDQQDLVNRAGGDLEGRLAKRFIVPLQARGGGAFATAPNFTQQTVLNAIRAKIKSLIGIDKNRNGVVVEQGQRYIDLHKAEYESTIKLLLDVETNFGLDMQPQAAGAMEPMQTMGLGRADNDMKEKVDRDAF